MPRRLRLDRPTDWHVFNRGSRRMALFRDDQDSQVFLRLLEEAVRESGCILWAYVLMTNHFHTALRGSSLQLQRCMHYAEGLYSAYHNRKYGLSGAAFEGRYEAYPQGTIPMLLRVIAYIFVNPVAAGLVASPQDYLWSNLGSFFTNEAPAISDGADVLLDRCETEFATAQQRLRGFIERELIRIERGQHRPGLSARDIQANHFDWMLEEAGRRALLLNQFDALTIALYWAKAAGFHPGALRQAIGGPLSSTLRAKLSRLRTWVCGQPDRAPLLALP